MLSITMIKVRQPQVYVNLKHLLVKGRARH